MLLVHWKISELIKIFVSLHLAQDNTDDQNTSQVMEPKQ